MTSSEAAENSAGWADRSQRIRLRFEGKDRARSLHNLTTQDINNLKSGQTREAFVTSHQGKTLAFATISAHDDFLLMRTERACWDSLKPHLTKYLMLDNTEFSDVSDSTFEFHVLGPQAPTTAASLGVILPQNEDDHLSAAIADRPVTVIRESPTGRPGWTIVGLIEDRDAVASALAGAGLVAIDDATFEFLRVEAGTPASGIDVLPENLPQEFHRDSRAIHFRKGCYLGQETVARLDALGHVNKILRGLTIESAQPPAPGSVLKHEDKPAGVALSVAASPESGRVVALAMIRVKLADPGTRLTWDGGEGFAEVHELPMRRA